tara:strand:- start:476 stop:1657 length:1182 start_codon:yes stop_codon:yes gene_type:complete
MGFNQRNNPFSRRSSSPLNQNGDVSSDPAFLKPAGPTWKTEDEQASMKADDPGAYYNWLTDMQGLEKERIAKFEQNVKDYALGTAENTKKDIQGNPTRLMRPQEFAAEDYLKSQRMYDWQGDGPFTEAQQQEHQDILDGPATGRYQFMPFQSSSDFDHAAVLRDNFPSTYKQVNESSRQFCNSFTCSIASQSGATMPRDMNRDGVVDEKDVYKIWEGGKEYKGGDAWPVLPGTAQFNTDMQNFGVTLADADTRPDPTKVQFIRKSSGGRAFPADGHSILQTGLENPNDYADIDGDGIKDRGVQIEGAWAGGPSIGDSYLAPSNFGDADGDGVADVNEGGESFRIGDYEGDLPYWAGKIESMAPWKAEQDEIARANEAAKKQNMSFYLGGEGRF